jgi:hypothetical protein
MRRNFKFFSIFWVATACLLSGCAGIGSVTVPLKGKGGGPGGDDSSEVGLKTRRIIPLILVSGCLIFFVCSGMVSASAVSPVEHKKIEALIHTVEGMVDAIFIRNGKHYNAALAAEFLRRKWRAHESEIKSATDFIDKVASFSSRSGKPYSIRWPDGRERLCAEFLRAQLFLLEGRSWKQPD